MGIQNLRDIKYRTLKLLATMNPLGILICLQLHMGNSSRVDRPYRTACYQRLGNSHGRFCSQFFDYPQE